MKLNDLARQAQDNLTKGRRFAQAPTSVSDWAASLVASPGYRRREWKRAAKRLMLPLVKPKSEAELVANGASCYILIFCYVRMIVA